MDDARMNKINNLLIKKQTGAALIVSLMMLLVMTLLGVSAMQTNILEEKMAGSGRDISLSLQAAETALREAEAYAESIVSPAAAFSGGTAWLYAPGSSPDVSRAATTWDTARSYASTTIDNVGTAPKYIIEQTSDIGGATNDINLTGYGESSGVGTLKSFRVTARGTGGSDTTVTILQSYYSKRY